MNNEDLTNNVVVLPYKDIFLEDLIDPEEIKKFLENHQLKSDLDKCLNEMRTPKER
jgi:hypothetical protein